MSIFLRQNKRQQITSIISGKNWDVQRMGKVSYKQPIYGYYFKNQGICIYYFYDKQKSGHFTRKKFDFGDVIYPETWSIKDDSVINVMGISYKVLYLSEKEITIINIMNSQDTINLDVSGRNMGDSTSM